MDVYNGPEIKYPLTAAEIQDLDRVWKFIKVFTKPYIYVTEYRNYLIKKLSSKYTPEQFFYLESVANKLFWNLRYRLASGKRVDSYCTKIPYTGPADLDKKLAGLDLYDTNYYRSFINKLVIVDKKDSVIYTKRMEGSSDIFVKNDFNTTVWNNFCNKLLYERAMRDPYKADNSVNVYYHQYDYGFPNLNMCIYQAGSDTDRFDRVKKMYYQDGVAKYWFQIII
jgi:hypothetical protein